MPGILFRATLADLLKVFAVTTSVLVTVIAFGAAIKPLSENLLSPGVLFWYVAFATIPMLQFALPFSAAFAGVIVYHRMAIDNEVLAMATSGISYRRILGPAFALGAILTVLMVVLVDRGVPFFWQSMQRVLASDVTRVFVAQVDRGAAFSKGGTEIYADEAHIVDAPADSGAAQRLILAGVAALELGPDDQPLREFASKLATVDVHRVGSHALVKAALQDATVFNHGDRAIAGSRVVRPEAIDLGRAVDEGPKGLPTRDLLALRRNPAAHRPIAEQEGRLADALAGADAWAFVGEQLGTGSPLRLQTTREGDTTLWTVEATELAGHTLRGAPLIVRQYAGETPDERSLRGEITASHATLALSASPRGERPRFDLLIDEALVRDPRFQGSGKGTRRAVRIADIEVADLTPLDRSTLSQNELLETARQTVADFTAGPSEEVRALVDIHATELAKQSRKLNNEIIARLVQRGSQSLTAILMLATASIFAIWLRSKTPLVVYLIAFVPALIDVLLISGGEQMLKSQTSAAGVLVALSGNAVLLAASLFGWWKLTRH